MRCKGQQFSDTMICYCGNKWDVNDSHPPECRKMFRTRKPFNHRFHKWCYVFKNLPKLLDTVHRLTIDIDDLKKENRNLKIQVDALRVRANKCKCTPLSDD